MTSAPSVATPGHRITVRAAYGATDVRACRGIDGRPRECREVDAILAAIDGELATLASAATHSAVVRRIFDELQTGSKAHACCDDD